MMSIIQIIFILLISTTLTQNALGNSHFFVSPSHPRSFAANGQELWISRSDCAKTSVVNQRILVSAIKPCKFHLFGAKDDTHPDSSFLTGISLSDENFALLTQCPDYKKYDWSQNPPFYSGTLSDFTKLAETKCNPLDLRASEDFFKESDNLFFELDSLLSKLGIRIASMKTFSNGHFVLKVFNTPSDIHKIRYNLKKQYPLLNSLMSFYEFEFLDSPKIGNTLVFDVDILEVLQNKREAYGIDYPTSVLSKSTALKNGLAHFVSTTEFELGIEAGQSQGWTQMIANPRLRTKPGKTAHFTNGGEVGFLHKSKNSSSFQWKSHGLDLKISPDKNTHMGQREITVFFEIDFTEPNNSDPDSDKPSLTKRSLEGEFDIRINEKTYLTSIQLKRSSKTQKGILGISIIPFIGSLFGKHSNSDQDSELWIAIRAMWETLS